MNLTFAYQTIHVENLDAIMAELRHYVDSVGSKWEIYPQPFHHVPAKQVLAHCTLFYSWCLSKRILPSIVAIMRLRSQPVPSPHIDYTDRNLALNFGLAIPEGSYTAIYSADDSGYRETLPSGGDRITVPLEHCREVARFDLSEPTIFNVQRPHAVATPPGTERLSITFRFYQDPWHLVNYPQP